MEVDFRNPPLWEQTCSGVLGFISRAVHLKPGVGATTVVLSFGLMIELIRLNAALHAAVGLERQRDTLRAQRAFLEARAHDVLERRDALIRSLNARREATTLAPAIARIGNAVGPTIALTALRRLTGGIQIEGKTTSLNDAAVTLRRLATTTALSDSVFSLRRDEGAGDTYSFSLAISGNEKRTDS